MRKPGSWKIDVTSIEIQPDAVQLLCLATVDVANQMLCSCSAWRLSISPTATSSDDSLLAFRATQASLSLMHSEKHLIAHRSSTA